MKRPDIMIISPSGNLYGSELVLLDYLSHTAVQAEVAVPAESQFHQRLKQLASGHRIRPYNTSGLKGFYGRLFLNLVTGRYRSVYLNEAGHVKYMLLLAKLFPSKKFIVHVRLFEDTARNRWFTKPGPNVIVIAISKYIATQLPVESKVVYDPFIFQHRIAEEAAATKEILTVGIIGRVTLTKGLNRLTELLKLIRDKGLSKNYRFLLYGAISEDVHKSGFDKELTAFDNVKMCGFESSAEKIYGSIDCVMHLSTQEALGRIYLEAIDYFKPFIGLQAAGIGEVAGLVGMNACMADPEKPGLPEQLLSLLEHIRMHYHPEVEKVMQVKDIAKNIFDANKYTHSLDQILA
jgi:glycosyltransferase involved in cell wall biosynthesis